MNFDLTDDQQDIKRTAREFLGARYKLEEVRRLALEEERGFTDAQWDEIVGLGWPELAVAESGLGIVELAVVSEELGYACAPTPLASTWAASLLLDAAGEAGRLCGREARHRRAVGRGHRRQARPPVAGRGPARRQDRGAGRGRRPT